MKKYRFEVAGKGYFPIDMLRYDACYPLDGDSVANMSGERTEGHRVVLLGADHEPTVARWVSFGWACKVIK